VVLQTNSNISRGIFTTTRFLGARLFTALIFLQHARARCFVR